MRGPITRRRFLSQFSSGYREYRPGPALASVVDCFWTFNAQATPAAPLAHSVLPDGRTDLVFQLGAPPGGIGDGAVGAYVVGAMLQPAHFHYTGPPRVLGVRFRPGGARAFVASPAPELVDRTVDLSAIWSGVAFLLDELGSARDDTARVARFERRLTERRREGVGADPAAIALERSGGTLAIADVARAAGLGERQLQRRIRDAVGYSPRTARRIARFIRASRILAKAPRTSWPELILACGYHDQPHLIREFRAFAGMTPVQFAAAHDVGSVQDGTLEEDQIAGRARRSA